MQFKGMLLMCSALITLTSSFPIDLQRIITTMHQNNTNLLIAKENEKPLLLIMEEKDPKSDSVVVQFFYTSNDGNSLVQTTGSEKDKYLIENPVQEEKKDKTNENENRNIIRIPNTQKPAQRPDNERKSDASKVEMTSSSSSSLVQTTGNEKDKYLIENPVQEEKKAKTLNENENENRNTIRIPNTQKPAQRPDNERKSGASEVEMTLSSSSLVPEEESPLSAKWPKYFYDTFNPIKPFPELQLQKPNKIVKDKIMKENDETYILNNGKERKDIPFVAGPQLNPLSIYDREFYVPIFD